MKNNPRQNKLILLAMTLLQVQILVYCSWWVCWGQILLLWCHCSSDNTSQLWFTACSNQSCSCLTCTNSCCYWQDIYICCWLDQWIISLNGCSNLPDWFLCRQPAPASTRTTASSTSRGPPSDHTTKVTEQPWSSYQRTCWYFGKHETHRHLLLYLLPTEWSPSASIHNWPKKSQR
jgi:hypothetical protein